MQGNPKATNQASALSLLLQTGSFVLTDTCCCDGGRFSTCDEHSSGFTPLNLLYCLISPSASIPNVGKLKAIAKLGAEEQEHEELWWKWLGGAALFSESLFLPGDARRGFAVGLSQELRLPAAPGAELFLGTRAG